MTVRVARQIASAGLLCVLVALLVGCASSAGPAHPTTTTTDVTAIPISIPTTVVAPATTAPRTTTTQRPTTVPAATTTLPATPTTPSPTTTSTVAATTTTTVAPSTTTTLPPGSALVLRDNGLGNAAFGADPDGVIDFVTGYIGKPTVDSGWVDPLSLGSCPGTEVRTVSWGDLDLYFGDESKVVVGRPHFFAYSYGPPFGATIEPAGLLTAGGIGVGSTVAQLKAAYPAVTINPSDATAPASFMISPALTGQLTGVDDASTVTAVSGGFGCGE
jgi:cell wall-associated NlpC family hydrolase